jgi:hypothetical protein
VRNLQLSVRGATSAASPTRYNLSGGMFDQQGIVVGSGLRRVSTRLNLNQSIGSRASSAARSRPARRAGKGGAHAGQQNANAGAVSAALQYVPILPVRREDGSYSYINTDLNAYNSPARRAADAEPGVARDTRCATALATRACSATCSASFTLLPGLQLRISGRRRLREPRAQHVLPAHHARGGQSNGEAIRAGSVTSGWLNENTLTYQRSSAASTTSPCSAATRASTRTWTART